MRLYFRWKLFFGFFGFALVVAGLLVAGLLLKVFGGPLLPGHPEVEGQFRDSLSRFLSWALVILGVAPIPPAMWIASRLNRPIKLLNEGMRQVADGCLVFLR